jgi:L-lactate dehydrogenase complex protein LldG
VQGIEAARRALDEQLRELAPKAALCWRHPLLERLDLSGLLANLGIEGWDHERLAGLAEPKRRATILAADVGLTSVAWAVAETGTLAVASEPGRERVASLLPPVHLALVAESQIVPDLYDLFALVRTADPTPTRRASEGEPAPTSPPGLHSLPSNLALITGPSKTGDIELQLTTGVHGPGTVRVLVVRGE